MTKKLDDAIAKVRELPDTDQDLAADLLLSILAEPMPLDDEARSAIREGLEQARRGEFVPDEEIQALWERHGA
jgi:predicted transcriptional regulator